MLDLVQLLTASLAQRASDLHLSAGLVPMMRVDGELKHLDLVVHTHEDLMASLQGIMSEAQWSSFSHDMACDFSFEIVGLSRFRVNVFQHMRGVGAVFRAIAHDFPTLQGLSAPDIFAEFASRSRGLVIVSGPTGSGKSTHWQPWLIT